MNRFQKMALLTRVLGGNNPSRVRKQLTHAMENQARGLVLIDDLDEEGNLGTPDSMVTFTDQGKDYRMTTAEAHRYAKHNFINTLFVLPAKGSLPIHEAK